MNNRAPSATSTNIVANASTSLLTEQLRRADSYRALRVIPVPTRPQQTWTEYYALLRQRRRAHDLRLPYFPFFSSSMAAA